MGWSQWGKSIATKNNGLELMISVVQSREFGWGVGLSKESLEEINKQRQGKKYFDEEAAKAVSDSIYKPDLIKDELVKMFECGGSNGYWSGSHMITLVEDVMDCLTYLFKDQYDYCFLFDHSGGHAKN